MAVVIGSRRGPGTASNTTQGAKVKNNPEARRSRRAHRSHVPAAVAVAWMCLTNAEAQPSGRAGRTLLVSELVPTDVVAFETRPP